MRDYPVRFHGKVFGIFAAELLYNAVFGYNQFGVGDDGGIPHAERFSAFSHPIEGSQVPLSESDPENKYLYRTVRPVCYLSVLLVCHCPTDDRDNNCVPATGSCSHRTRRCPVFRITRGTDKTESPFTESAGLVSCVLEIVEDGLCICR